MPRVKRAASRQKVQFAREQRRSPTRSEQVLWAVLRDDALGPRFRRQHPIGDFVLDFYCDDARLAVEVDGPTHAERPGYDEWRDERLAREGIRVLRVAANDVDADVGAVVERIRRSLTP